MDRLLGTVRTGASIGGAHRGNVGENTQHLRLLAIGLVSLVAAAGCGGASGSRQGASSSTTVDPHVAQYNFCTNVVADWVGYEATAFVNNDTSQAAQVTYALGEQNPMTQWIIHFGAAEAGNAAQVGTQQAAAKAGSNIEIECSYWVAHGINTAIEKPPDSTYRYGTQPMAPYDPNSPGVQTP